jgi:hypothetical protein
MPFHCEIRKIDFRNFLLAINCDNRIIARMNKEACDIIDDFGGTSAVARLISAPISTVHSWRKNGIPASRLAHMRLARSVMSIQLEGNASERAA